MEAESVLQMHNGFYSCLAAEQFGKEMVNPASKDRVGKGSEHGPDEGVNAMTDAALQKKAIIRISELIDQTLEEEIFALNSLEPNVVARFPKLFSESVIDSVTSILGESSGEALIRRIGEERLRRPAEVYEILDSVLHDGSEILKAVIREDFRVRVHRLCKMMMDTRKRTIDMAPLLGLEPNAALKSARARLP